MSGETLSFVDLLQQAGWAMAPLYVCSVVGLAVVIRKLVEFRSAGVHRAELLAAIDRPLREGDFDAVESSAKQDGTPLGRVVAAAAGAVREHHSRAEEETGRVASIEIQILERYLGLIAWIAQVAPLFGLLGTVIGMVDLFSGLESAGQTVDASTLSSGIWKALLTTAAGLIIAIPLLGAHAWLTGQSDALRLRMKDGAGRVFTHAAGHAISRQSATGRLKTLE